MVKLNQISLTDFVLLVLLGIKEKHDQSFLTGRTMAQKVVYLITRDTDLRQSWGVHYRIHYYGPYSSEVSEALEYLTTFGLLTASWKEMTGYTRCDFRLTDQGEQHALTVYSGLDAATRARIDKMMEEAARLNAEPLAKVIKKAYAQAKVEKLS